jgi:hypothetical protein
MGFFNAASTGCSLHHGRGMDRSFGLSPIDGCNRARSRAVVPRQPGLPRANFPNEINLTARMMYPPLASTATPHEAAHARLAPRSQGGRDERSSASPGCVQRERPTPVLGLPSTSIRTCCQECRRTRPLALTTPYGRRYRGAHPRPFGSNSVANGLFDRSPEI